LDGIDLGPRHRAGDLGEFHGERSAETAAFLGDVHFSEREALYLRQQSARACFDAQLAEGVTTVVIRDDAMEPRAHIVDARNFQQESRKLPDSRLQRMNFGKDLGIVLEDVREVMRNHRRAGARRHDDVFGIAEDIQEVPRDGARFVRIAGIKRRLAATSLGRGKVNLVSQALQHLRDGDADLGKNLIDDAGDKQRNGLAHWGEFNMPGELRIEAVDLITVGDTQPREENYLALERGDILYFPRSPFAFSEEERELLRSTGLSSSSHHKNVAYRPEEDKVTGFDPAAVSDPGKLRDVMRAYSERALALLWKLLPRYMEKARIDFASFRPQEEEGRDLPTKKRNDLLHVDAFPTRPTRGDMILRFFTNIHATKPRVWMTSDPFGMLAPRYANAAGLEEVARHPKGSLGARVLGAFGGVEGKRSAYDRFMLGFHDYLKFNGEYQEICPKYRFEFPPDSTWMVFTDLVPHSVLSGRYALEQTVIVRRESLARPESAPIEILQRICGRQLG
jgi:3-deoxy-D-manno-oct-2-ulosonic acid (Kdo) hydroxylase